MHANEMVLLEMPDIDCIAILINYIPFKKKIQAPAVQAPQAVGGGVPATPQLYIQSLFIFIFFNSAFMNFILWIIVNVDQQNFSGVIQDRLWIIPFPDLLQSCAGIFIPLHFK